MTWDGRRIPFVNGTLDDTYGHIKTAIGSVLEGRSYSDEEVKEMIAPVPDKNFKKVCTMFFSAAACFEKQGRGFWLLC